MVAPDRFIPIAEQAGLIEEMTEFLLRDAARFASTWPSDVLLSFNLSTVSLVKPGTSLRILSNIAGAGLSPRKLQVEVTETALMQDFEAARRTIEHLRRSGVGVVLDDFGTGHSSLGYIQRITFDKIKIDKEFITGLVQSEKSRHILEAVIGLCSKLGMRCVAEGIEDDRQIEILEAQGCQLGQGYLFARPMPAEALSGLLAAQTGLGPDRIRAGG